VYKRDQGSLSQRNSSKRDFKRLSVQEKYTLDLKLVKEFVPEE
jgi:hypothetical protein